MINQLFIFLTILNYKEKGKLKLHMEKNDNYKVLKSVGINDLNKYNYKQE